MKTEASNLASQLLGVLARAQAKAQRAREKLHPGLPGPMENLGIALELVEKAHDHVLGALNEIKTYERAPRKPDAS